MEVKPGDRVVIHGLKGRPELNNQSAVLVGPAANGRVNVRLDSGESVALKQENLGIAAPGGGGGGGSGMPGFGGGMPGFGGMSGGMPGMPQMPPGGLPAMAEQLTAALQQRLAAAGIRLPSGVSPAQAAIGVVIAAIVALYVLSRFLSMTVLMLVGLAAYWGTQVDSGRTMLARGSARISSVLGRPLPPHAALIALCIVVALVGQTFLSGRASTGAPPRASPPPGSSPSRDAFSDAIREAYQQGYDDGAAGKEPRPPKHIPAPEYEPEPSTGQNQKASSSGFGVSSMVKYGMAAYFVYNLGKTPGGWDPQLAMVNARQNPMQAVMLVVMLSGVIM